MSMIAKNRIHSAWTPLSNEETNNKILKGIVLLGAGRYTYSFAIGDAIPTILSPTLGWALSLSGRLCNFIKHFFQFYKHQFSKWNDDQRRKLFEELIGTSKRKQLDYARDLIDNRFPNTNADFTRVLPRVITMYIFSFLDARSLCQCAQVCWYWRYLSELDHLWMSKCLHFGWYLTFTPSPYENGVWKRNFIEKYRIIRAQMPKNPALSEMSKLTIGKRGKEKSNNSAKKNGPQPWKGSDPVPQDTWRYNYLNNDEAVHEVAKRRQKKVYGQSVDDIVKNAKSKINTGSHVLNSLTKSQSLTSMNGSSKFPSSERPRWAKQGPQTSSSQFYHKDAMKQNGVLASITRPGPIIPPTKVAGNSPSSKPVTARSARDPPTTELFPESPWRIPTQVDSDDED